VGIEMLHLSRRVAGMDAQRLLFETVPITSWASPERKATAFIASQPHGSSCGVSMPKGKRT
jgi:hypothetical protein